MFVKNLDHLNLSVSNFAETVAWYGRIFDFELVEQGHYRGEPWGVIKAGEAMLCIYQTPSRTLLDGASLREKNIHGVNHFSLRITDRTQWEATLSREQLPVAYGGAVEWPHSTAWYVQDPTGYEIEVAYWKEDRIAFS